MNLMTMPGRVLRQADRSMRRAVSNASEASAALTSQVAQRAALSPSTRSEAEPGELVRLSRDECHRLLRTQRVGRYAHVGRGRGLSVVPVNYVVTDENVVMFRSGPGPKLSSAQGRDLVAFEVDDIDLERHAGWSVLITGHAHRLTFAEEKGLACLPEPWATGPRTQVVAIIPSHIDGRRLC